MPERAVILLVEDNEADVLLTEMAFEKAPVNNLLQVVRSGEEAVTYLLGAGKYGNRAEHPLPTLILLDLKLPGMDGFELLSWLRQQRGLRNLQVIVLSCSTEIRDVNRAQRLGANAFLIKEMDFSHNVELALIMHKYWLEKSAPPSCNLLQLSREDD